MAGEAARCMPYGPSIIEAARRYGDIDRHPSLYDELGSRVVDSLIEEAIIPESAIADRACKITETPRSKGNGWQPRIVR